MVSPYSINDTIWGIIGLNKWEHRVISTSIFKRLLNIRQMSLAYITFLGANHTRYEHSIGTMHVAYNLLLNIENLRDKISDKYYNFILQTVKFAALLHDIGHTPYSHAVEWAFKREKKFNESDDYSHEFNSKEIILSDPELDVIFTEYLQQSNDWDEFDSYSKPIQKEIIKEFKVIISHLVMGEETIEKGQWDSIEDWRKNLKLEHSQHDFCKLEELKKFIPIIDGDMDADKIDYIARDCYYCGKPSDINSRFLNECLLHIDKNNNIVLQEDSIHILETILFSRMKLMDLIHHETKSRIANQLLMRSVNKFLSKETDKKSKSISHKMHRNWVDYDMTSYIKKNQKKNKGSVPWGLNFFRGDIIKGIFKYNFNSFSPQNRLEIILINEKAAYITTLKDKICTKILEDSDNSKVHLDFCIIKTPKYSSNYLIDTKKELTDSSINFNEILKGIYNESFRRSFLSIYFDENVKIKKPSVDCISKCITEVADIIKDNTAEVADIIKDKTTEVFFSDILITALVAIDNFAKESLEIIGWPYSLWRFQHFLNTLIEFARNEAYTTKIYSLKGNTEESIDRLLENEWRKLSACKILDVREKLMLIRNNRYIIRYDIKISNLGREYFEHTKECNNNYSKKIRNLELFAKEKLMQNLKQYHHHYKVYKDCYINSTLPYDDYRKKIKNITTKLMNNGVCPIVV